MTRFYPECDSYECEVCPRRDTCDIREQDDDGAIPLDLDANPDQLRIFDELERKLVSLQAQVSELRIEVKRLMRHESEFMAQWCRIAEGRDDE